MTSNKLASDAHTKGLKYSSVADENGVIDLTTSPAGTYYIDFEIGEYANSNLNLKLAVAFSSIFLVKTTGSIFSSLRPLTKPREYLPIPPSSLSEWHAIPIAGV